MGTQNSTRQILLCEAREKLVGLVTTSFIDLKFYKGDTLCLMVLTTDNLNQQACLLWMLKENQPVSNQADNQKRKKQIPHLQYLKKIKNELRS